MFHKVILLPLYRLSFVPYLSFLSIIFPDPSCVSHTSALSYPTVLFSVCVRLRGTWLVGLQKVSPTVSKRQLGSN